MLLLRTAVVFCIYMKRTIAIRECETKYSGQCISIFDDCKSGNLLTESHCGFLEACCYPPHTDYSNSSTLQPHISQNETCGYPLVSSEHKIVGGHLSIHGAYPWQVSMRYQGSHVCGGTLINDQWIITAAHCFEDSPLTDWTMGLGLQDLHNTHGNLHHTSRIIVHTRYNGKIMLNDIALVKLKKPVDIKGKYVRPACLPSRGETFDRKVCTATGWGATHSDGPVVGKLREVDLAIIPNNHCAYYLQRGDVHVSNICAGFIEGRKDTCQGDSGGPLACPVNSQWKVAGIVSWGYGCADKNSPGLYTRVESFLDWIQTEIQKHP